MTRDELTAQQWAKFTGGLDDVLATNPFYQEKLRQAGLTAAAFRSPADLARLPLTTKEELLADQQAQPLYGTNLTYPLGAYTRLHQTSGSSGRRLRWLDTPASWSWILDCWDLIYRAIELRTDDRLFFAFSFGPFLGFWAGFEGALRQRCFVIAGGGMSTLARLQCLRENAVTIVLCTPTYALRLAELAEHEGIDLAGAPVRALVLAGEPGGNIAATRRRIETAWGARVFDHSGMTEIGSLGIEFAEHPGKLFLLETECIAEFLAPGTNDAVPAGTLGELVITNLGRWGSPLLRYRTGDLVRWRADEAPAGYPFVYLDGGILGRADDMLWIKGNNVYPSAVEDIVRTFTEVAEFALEAVDSVHGTNLRILVEPTSPIQTETLAARVAKAVHDRLYFHPEVKVVAANTLPRFEMKASRFRRC